MNDGTSPRRISVGRLMGVVAVLALAWFFAGLLGLVVAAIGLGLCEIVGPRWVAASAAAALVVAALATLLESSAVNIAFTAQRPFASDAGEVAAVLALSALSAFVANERAAPDHD